MKNCVYLIISLLFVCHPLFGQELKEDNAFILQGKVKGRDTGILVLRYTNTFGTFIKDTTFLNQGYFRFRGYITDPTSAMLIGKTSSNSLDDPNLVRLFLEPNKMTADVEEVCPAF